MSKAWEFEFTFFLHFGLRCDNYGRVLSGFRIVTHAPDSRVRQFAL